MALMATWADELFFGGARGGGKSDYLLADFLQNVYKYGENWQGILFRRTNPELEELISRAKDLYPLTGGEWFVGRRQWEWPNGATLKMRFLERPDDASKYQGHQYTWIGWDELTQWGTDEAYNMLKACLRWAKGDVPTKRIRASGNPGGPGHDWVKQYFIDSSPGGGKVIIDPVTKMKRLYVKSRVSDNQELLKKDPGYVDRLRGTGSPELVRAWLEGDWNAIVGAYFDEFSYEKHVIPPMELPDHWIRFRSFDWGGSHPFSVGWFAVADGSVGELPSGALVQYREWYGASGPNKGLKMRNEDIADGILERELPDEEITYSIADPAVFQEHGGPSIAEIMRGRGVSFRAGDNKRVPGWNALRSRLIGQDDLPMVYFFDTCVNMIRTLPLMQHDERRPEDVDTKLEDHAADMLRYACMSRPYVAPHEDPSPLQTMEDLTLNKLFELDKKHKRRNKREDRIS